MAYIHRPRDGDFFHNGCWYTTYHRYNYFSLCEGCYKNVGIGPSGVLDGRFDDYQYYNSLESSSIPEPDYWWEANTGVYSNVDGTTPAVNDDSVASWKSVGKNKTLFVQSGAGKPVLKVGAVGSKTQSGVLFTAASSQYLWHDSKLFNTDTGIIFAVIQFATAPNNQYILGMRGLSDNLAYFGVCTANITFNQYYIQRNTNAATTIEISYENNLSDGTPHVLAWLQNSSKLNFWQQGVEVKSTDNTNWTVNVDAERTSIGALYGNSASGYMNGYISEILVYETVLTESQMTIVNSYLTNKYV